MSIMSNSLTQDTGRVRLPLIVSAPEPELPSNPVVSIGTILAVPGVRDALRSTPARVVGVSPIVGGAPVRGMADACLAAIGVETTAAAVARHYGRRSGGGVLDAWLVDD